MEEPKRDLGQIQQFELPYPRQGQKAPPRTLNLMSK